ncbi:MAG TPA: hypothetical protein PLB52_02505 [Candidatus Moranbacteria bacterium]|mgnify:FL=1|nr:hypothetical protein [Candidatus Moranbacteria bacterium]
MKKNVNMITQSISLLVAFAGLVYVFNVIIKVLPGTWIFINSQFFTAILTLFVGLLAYIIYLRQKADHKKDIANLILQEIRYAEQKLREARSRDHVYLLAHKLLPTNSWHSNIHLFISVLEENQVDTISRFYSSVEFLDYLIKEIAREKAFPEKSSNGTPLVIQPSMSLPVNNQPGVSMPQPAQIMLGFDSIGQAQSILKEISQQIEFIYNSPSVDILRKIAIK